MKPCQPEDLIAWFSTWLLWGHPKFGPLLNELCSSYGEIFANSSKHISIFLDIYDFDGTT